MDDFEFENESIDTHLVSPLLDSNDKLDDREVLNELNKYGNAGNFYCNRIINSIDGDDLAILCMIGIRKYVAYFDFFLPINIITRKSYNTIMVEGLKNTGRNLVAIVRDVYVFVGSITYDTGFVVIEDIREFIVSDMSEVIMGRPFRAITQLEYDCVKGRKAHLLEHKQILSVGVFDEVLFSFGRHLEEIHVTWTQYGKKRDKIATLHKDDEELIVRDVPKAAVLAYCYVLLDREANGKVGSAYRILEFSCKAPGK
ncbi:hypothetical protein Tco_1576023 [Tanacetum coccineum]